MAERSRGGIFRKRNVLGLTLIAGMVVGTYLPNIWKGFGGGSTWGIGIGDPADGLQIETQDASTDDELDATIPAAQPQPQSLIKVIIDERSFFIRSATGDRPTELTEIIALATAATGDADGFRVKIYRKGSSRPSAENALNDALSKADIAESAVLWVPTEIE